MGEISTHDMDDDQHTNANCTISTNWTISRGSLESSIAFESSDSPIDSDSAQLTPLILHRPSPDSSPCEIKLCFMQKHEIRQVYIRSTARVYEMYYAPTLQSDNEYLSTVRCSIAERDGEFLQTGGVEVVTQQNMKDYVGKTTEGSVTAEAKHCTSEDDWVEVKVPDSPFSGNEGSIEDLYEATAQISDSDPCMSLTIRVLSLQNKCSVCIDEVYIFGDPIESDETVTPAVPVENQASSFMAMLLPTLLQLSKPGISHKQDKYVSDRQRKENEVEIASRTSDFADAEKENNQEKRASADHLAQLDVNDKPIAEPAHTQPLAHQNLSRENYNNISTMNNDASQSRIERALEQLLDRVSRIENICLKFEEKMVSPMNSMETRLQRLEQQVEILAKNSQCSGVTPSTRIAAPSFTCSESNSSSLYNDGSEYRHCGASELEKNDLPCNKLSDSSDDKPVSIDPSHVLANHVIAAPEFSCGEDEESDIVESANVSSKGTQKQVLSIDDALAAALSGFLSTSHVLPPHNGTSEVIASASTSEVVNEKKELSQSAQSASVIACDYTLEGNGSDRPSKYTQILAIAAPDFPEEYEFENPNFSVGSSAAAPELASEENGNNGIASPSTGSLDQGGFIDLNRNKSMPNAGSTVASEPYAEQEKFLQENVYLNETSGIIGSKDLPYGQESVCKSQDDATVCPSDQDDKVAESNIRDSTNEPQMNSHYLEIAAEPEEHDASKGSHVDVIENACGYSRPSALDFDIPILDVKFAADEDSDTKFSLDVLLGDMAKVNVEAPLDDENGVYTIVDDELPKFSAGDGNLLVDFGIYGADAFTSLDGHSYPSTSSNQDVFIGLI